MGNLYRRTSSILGWAFREINQGAVDLEKLYGLLGMQSRSGGQARRQTTCRWKGGAVSFDNVSSRTMPARRAMTTFLLDVPAGSSSPSSGPVWLGKSTLLKCCSASTTLGGGRVRVDGQDVRDLEAGKLRVDAIGLVPQEVVLFNSSMKDNLLYGRPDATDDQLRDAAPPRPVRRIHRQTPQWLGHPRRRARREALLAASASDASASPAPFSRDPCHPGARRSHLRSTALPRRDVQGALEEAAKGRTTAHGRPPPLDGGRRRRDHRAR